MEYLVRSAAELTWRCLLQVGLLFDEAFLRSGYHPVAVAVDPTLLKSAVSNDPELEVHPPPPHQPLPECGASAGPPAGRSMPAWPFSPSEASPMQAALRLDELREENAAQQKALTEARRQFEMLESR